MRLPPAPHAPLVARAASRGARARRRGLRALALVASLLLAACGGEDELGRVVIRLRATNLPAELRPTHAALSWFDDAGPLLDARRVPGETGRFPEAGVDLATIVIGHGGPEGSRRRLLVHGLDATEQRVALASAELRLARGEVTLELELSPLRPAEDADGDGVPDPLDVCPTVPNPRQTPDCAGPDAGPPPDGAADAGSPEAGAPPLDAAVEARGPAPDAPPPGGPGADAASPSADAAPAAPDAARAKIGDPCTSDAACASGACVASPAGRFCATAGMVFVPAGPFQRGCAAGDPACSPDERPAAMITLGAFEIERDEVTQAAYDRCVAAGACRAPAVANPARGADLPVLGVGWAQARAYCAHAYAGGRLPTEAEWEKAARGPTARIFPWGNDPVDCTRANWRGCGNRPLPVGGRPAGASFYGARDMAGNADEWTEDWYEAGYYATAASQAANPPGPQSGAGRVRRGGSYDTETVDFVRTSNRIGETPAGAFYMGLRCARATP
jgi:formylglycine-generating enzyme required for sulfatase activity